MRLAALTALVLAVPAAGAGAALPRVSAPAPVTALAFDGPRVAYAADRSRDDCARVRIWNVRRGSITRLGRPFGCVETSTGSGVAAVSLAGSRALWLYFTGGNVREWFLFTATERASRARRLAFAAGDVDVPPPIVLGPGDSGRLGGVLPYAVGRRVVALHPDGTRRFAWTAPARVVGVAALAAPHVRVAVAQAGGVVSVLDGGGTVVREERYAEEVGAVRLTPTGVLVQRGRTLEYRGDRIGTWLGALPAPAMLMDVTGAEDRANAALEAIYVLRGEVRARRIGGLRDVRLAGGMLAAAEGDRVATAGGRTITVRPR